MSNPIKFLNRILGNPDSALPVDFQPERIVKRAYHVKSGFAGQWVSVPPNVFLVLGTPGGQYDIHTEGSVFLDEGGNHTVRLVDRRERQSKLHITAETSNTWSVKMELFLAWQVSDVDKILTSQFPLASLNSACRQEVTSFIASCTDDQLVASAEAEQIDNRTVAELLRGPLTTVGSQSGFQLKQIAVVGRKGDPRRIEQYQNTVVEQAHIDQELELMPGRREITLSQAEIDLEMAEIESYRQVQDAMREREAAEILGPVRDQELARKIMLLNEKQRHERDLADLEARTRILTAYFNSSAGSLEDYTGNNFGSLTPEIGSLMNGLDDASRQNGNASEDGPSDDNAPGGGAPGNGASGDSAPDDSPPDDGPPDDGGGTEMDGDEDSLPIQFLSIRCVRKVDVDKVGESEYSYTIHFDRGCFEVQCNGTISIEPPRKSLLIYKNGSAKTYYKIPWQRGCTLYEQVTEAARVYSEIDAGFGSNGHNRNGLPFAQ